MKKKLLYILFISLLLLSGCEKKSTKIAPASLFVLDGNVTSEGIRPGDGPDAFKKAYRSYTLQVAWTDVDSNYMVMSPDEIPYDENISTIITSHIKNTPGITPQGFNQLLCLHTYFIRLQLIQIFFALLPALLLSLEQTVSKCHV